MDEFKMKLFTSYDPLSSNQTAGTVDFLHTHLDQFGDPKDHISKAIDYAISDNEGEGGFVINCLDGDKIIGTVVVNKTGMEGYIPENILVYIAVDKTYRGKGLGKKLMQYALKVSDGGVALHVEPDNPAKFLYEKLGFENKYLEMRYTK
ncbi:MAG: GNAT family N-acetyltransferase [Saprospiraceae bacterium]|nr:GNAT family N-acetyltransferase [Saprospiraceae bacterium]